MKAHRHSMRKNGKKETKKTEEKETKKKINKLTILRMIFQNNL